MSQVVIPSAGGFPDRERGAWQRTGAVESKEGAAGTPQGRDHDMPADQPAAPQGQVQRGQRGRRFGLVVGLAALLLTPAVLSGVLSSLRPTVYAAQADVLYDGSGSGDASVVERELATQQVLMESRPLLNDAAADVGRSPRELVDAVAVEVVEPSNVLRLRVEDRDRERARATAQAIVERYTRAVASQATSTQLQQERDVLQDRITARTTRLRAVNSRVNALSSVLIPTAAQQTEQRALEGEAQIIREQLADLEAQAVDADLRAVQRGDVQARLLAAPFVLDDPVAPQPLRAAAAGLLLGLVLAVALLALLRLRAAERSGPPQP